MRCSCRLCGTYMIQAEHGLKSACTCPDCKNTCNDCMGTEQTPLSKDALQSFMLFRMATASKTDDE